jgi:penicillin-binding protein 1C
VNLLQQLRVSTFLAFLRDHGVSRLDANDGRYGLSVAIGALEVSLLELTDLYAALARGGLYRRAMLASDEPQDTRRELSAGAAHLTRVALTARDRPDFPFRKAHVVEAPNVFWKTGTSYGHRDAWALGANGRYAVGVWLGNFDNSPSRSLVGAVRAGPILFDLLDAFSDRSPSAQENDVPDAPSDLIAVEVCALSGRIPNDACPHRTTVLALERNVPTELCPFHLLLRIDEDTGYALCRACAHGRPHREERFTVPPGAVRTYLVDRSAWRPSPPIHNPQCQTVLPRRPPRIVEPQAGTEFFMVPGLAADRQEIPLVVDADPREAEVFWFVDGRLMARTEPEKRVWLTPHLGRIEIKVLDSTGRSDTLIIEVNSI